MNAKKILLGVVVGGIASGIATLLTTPQSGVALRKNLVRSEEEWRQNLAALSTSIRDLSQEVASVTKEGKVVLSSLITDIKISVQAWKESTADNQHAIKIELDLIQEALRKLENDLGKN